MLQPSPSLLPPFIQLKVGGDGDVFSPPFGDGMDSPPPPVILNVVIPLVMGNTWFGFTINRAVGYIVQWVVISF